MRSYMRWDDDVCFVFGQQLDIDSANWLKQQSFHLATYTHNMYLILRKPVFALTPEYCVLNRKTVNTNVIVFGLTWQMLDSTNYHTRGEHNSRYTTDVSQTNKTATV